MESESLYVSVCLPPKTKSFCRHSEAECAKTGCGGQAIECPSFRFKSSGALRHLARQSSHASP